MTRREGIRRACFASIFRPTMVSYALFVAKNGTIEDAGVSGPRGPFVC